MALNTSKVFRGNWAKIVIDGITFSNVKGCKWTMKPTTEKVPQTGSLTEAEIQTGLECTGELKFTKTDSKLLKMIFKKVQNGEAQSFTIITSQASDIGCKNEEKIRLLGCAFTEVTSEWEAGKITEESFPFTFKSAEAVTWGADDK